MNSSANTFAPDILITYGATFAKSTLAKKLSDRGFNCLQVNSADDLVRIDPAVLILDPKLLQNSTIEEWRETTDAIILAEEWVTDKCDLILANESPENSTAKLLELACRQWVLQRRCETAENNLKTKQEHIDHLAAIGIALSAEKDLGNLLNKILDEGQDLCRCDASSLFLVTSQPGQEKELIFKLTKNNSIDVPFKEFRFPMTNQSIVGHVAINNTTVNLEDAYDIPKNRGFGFDISFDKQTNYRTKSLIAIPMCNYRQEVIGVLEFINKKVRSDVPLTSPEIAEQYVEPFDDADLSIIRALAGQAAVAIENKLLIEKVNELFDGFVRASVTAIEQRDPTTSGHSFRVADFCTGLAQALPQSNHPEYKKVDFSSDEIRELRYAALLHDFGKVGVREHVLIKAKKLMPERLETLHYRIALVKERLQNKAFKDVLALYESNSGDISEQHNKITLQLQIEIQKLDGYLEAILKANEPTILPEGSAEHLREVLKYPFLNLDGNEEGLIDDYDFLALSVRRGSLTEHERKEIESHVIHTYRFLNFIPWTPELARIPEIAGAHHEKLDGTGYPDNKTAEQIPLASKIMTIADIFDALTASDRPYKKAMPKDRALNILEDEAKKGMLETSLVNIFIESRTYDMDVEKVNPINDMNSLSGYSNHPCDFDLHNHPQHSHGHNEPGASPIQ